MLSCGGWCASRRPLERLIRGDISESDKHKVRLEKQVTVVDLHNLPDRQAVRGRRDPAPLVRREGTLGQATPAALRRVGRAQQVRAAEGNSPIKEILLDVAERGRSLGIILIGAQQTASEVEARIVGQCAIRVVGRLDSAEAERGQYGFLRGPQRDRATIAKPGTMMLSQPEIASSGPRVPVPGVGHPSQRGRGEPGRRGPPQRPPGGPSDAVVAIRRGSEIAVIRGTSQGAGPRTTHPTSAAYSPS